MNRPRRVWPLWIALLATIALGVAVIAFPTFYIMPFKPQKASVMALALQARAVAPLVTTITAVLSAAMAIALVVRSRRWWSRTLAVLALAPIGLATWFAHQNHFEWMFNPLESPRYVSADKAKFVKPDDVVMAVEIGGEAVAYPVRQIGYHHVVNDVIGRRPIVATY
jgi:Protein of unknown function (DUF3179)